MKTAFHFARWFSSVMLFALILFLIFAGLDKHIFIGSAVGLILPLIVINPYLRCKANFLDSRWKSITFLVVGFLVFAGFLGASDGANDNRVQASTNETDLQPTDSDFAQIENAAKDRFWQSLRKSCDLTDREFSSVVKVSELSVDVKDLRSVRDFLISMDLDRKIPDPAVVENIAFAATHDPETIKSFQTFNSYSSDEKAIRQAAKICNSKKATNISKETIENN